MKLFKTIDEKFFEIGFIKIKENKYGVTYERKKEFLKSRYNYTQTLALIHKKDGNHLMHSYDANLMDENKIGNIGVGLTMYEMKLCIKKMKQMGWKVSDSKNNKREKQ